MLLKQYKYFLFDLDRTLWDFDLNSKNAIFKLLDKYNICSTLGIKPYNDNGSVNEIFFERYETINQELWNKYESNIISKETLRIDRFANTFKSFGPSFKNLIDKKESFHQFCSDFSDEYLENMVLEKRLIPGTKKVLRAIKKNNGFVAILSNGFKEVQYRKLKRPGLMPYIDTIVISEEIGIHKPNPLIYKKAIENLLYIEKKSSNNNIIITENDITEAKKSAIMIGDDFPKDIEGAQVYGIDQFYYNRYAKPCYGAPTYESNRLEEIL